MIFPEGTRSPDGRLQGFKAGAFEIAFRMNAPVLPIVVDGTARALPKRGFLLRGKQAIRVRVLPPITPPWTDGTSAASLRAAAHAMIGAELAALRSGGAI